MRKLMVLLAIGAPFSGEPALLHSDAAAASFLLVSGDSGGVVACRVYPRLSPTGQGEPWLLSPFVIGPIQNWGDMERQVKAELQSNAGLPPSTEISCDYYRNSKNSPADIAGHVERWMGNPSKKVEYVPSIGRAYGSHALASKRQVETVFFRDPRPSLGEKGYSNNTFDVEYQFITCQGELHLAYSLVENSVKSKQPTYLLDGTFHRVSPPSPGIESIPLFGEVWVGSNTKRIVGKYADDHAGKALGWGCFSGQTKKIANLSDLTNGAGKPITKDELPAFIEQLRVNFVTKQVLTSNAAEEEIRSGNAKKVADVEQRSGQQGLDAAAEERARRKAERDAEFAAKQAKYQADLAAQQKAVADFEAAQRQVAADKAAAAARAKAAQEEFARQQAAHQAELDRHARERAEYEAKVAGQASVTIPRN